LFDSIFKAPETTGQQMADALPVGRAWASKNTDGTNTRGLINSLAVAHNQTQQRVEALNTEFQINRTWELIDEWEESVGIPNVCATFSETIERRRHAVIERLRKVPKVTLQHLQGYVDDVFPGMGVVLHPGLEYYSFEYGFEVPLMGGVDIRFVLVAEVPLSDSTFEYEWEMIFEGGVDTTQLECVLNEIIPANVLLIIEFKG